MFSLYLREQTQFLRNERTKDQEFRFRGFVTILGYDAISSKQRIFFPSFFSPFVRVEYTKELAVEL